MLTEAVSAHIVHIQTQPVTGAVHVEMAISPLFDQAINIPEEQAKVDEPFGEVVKDVYARAMARRGAGVSTKLPDRIEDLLALHFPTKPPGMWDTRYQLLYATAGTLAAGMDASVLYIIVFRTPAYDPEVGRENERDFTDFMRQIGATDLKGDRTARAYKMRLGGKDLYCVYDYYDL